jgi:hypothetical protein
LPVHGAVDGIAGFGERVCQLPGQPYFVLDH